MAPIIRTEKLRKVYAVGKERVVALNNVDLSIEKGEFCCIVGQSGSGKSTLLNQLAGLEKPTRGTVKIRGELISKMSEKQLAVFRQKHIGFVFQSYNLIQGMTAVENVAMPLMFKGISRSQRLAMARKELKNMGLGGRAEHMPTEMSGGQQQRVGIARAYANSPNIMLLDEPFGQLDAQTRMFMQKETARIWEQEKRTVIFVTNNIDEALFLGDRIILMEGKLPGSIKTEYMIDLPRPREHTSMELLKLRSIITDNTALVL